MQGRGAGVRGCAGGAGSYPLALFQALGDRQHLARPGTPAAQVCPTARHGAGDARSEPPALL